MLLIEGMPSPLSFSGDNRLLYEATCPIIEKLGEKLFLCLIARRSGMIRG